jgi:hypothetical protein
MKLSEIPTRIRRRLALEVAVATLAVCGCLGPARACTIFVLADKEHTLFCNNEDWSNPASRIWFRPAGNGWLGCAYVGFDNGWAQGGVNTAGLAFDWVTGYPADWQRAPGMESVRGNPSERMLESCATVAEAIAFYRTHWEPDFARSRLMVADRSGASAIIGARDGRLHAEDSTRCRGFGHGGAIVERRLATPPEPTATNAVAILRECFQTGEFATKYSDVFDLRSGDLFLYPAPGKEEFSMNLAVELAKGAHVHELPRLRESVAEPPHPLPPSMRRFYLDEFAAIADPNPAITRRVAAIVRDAEAGTMQSRDYAEEFWKQLAPAREEMRGELAKLGRFVSLVPVAATPGGDRTYRYLIDFENVRVLQRYTFDAHDRLTGIESEASETKPKRE